MKLNIMVIKLQNICYEFLIIIILRMNKNEIEFNYNWLILITMYFKNLYYYFTNISIVKLIL
jgi:hypothetical protein